MQRNCAHIHHRTPSRMKRVQKGSVQQRRNRTKKNTHIYSGRPFVRSFLQLDVPEHKIPKLYSQDFKIVIRIPARFNVEYVGSWRVKSGTYLNVHFIIWLVVCELGLAARQRGQRVSISLIQNILPLSLFFFSSNRGISRHTFMCCVLLYNKWHRIIS